MSELIGMQTRGYELRDLIGKGGYGAVYKAWQPTVGREVAIKVILQQHAQDPEFQRRFEGEAQVVAQLEHPFIVPLYDYWQDENGAFLVMRFVRGGSLRDRLKANEALDPKALLRLYDQIGAALMISHEIGVFHRDINPDNVLIDQYENAYLTDFGIAKNLKLDVTATLSDDTIVGTPAYLSPEQIRSDPVSPQSDIYALGIMLYELLTGVIPFNAPGMQMLMQHIQEPVPSLRLLRPDFPPALDDIIARACAKEAADRYADVSELLDALHAVFAPQVAQLIPAEAQPRMIAPNRHVFISYSRADNEFIQRLIYDLESEGVPVWVDKRGLKPGTRNWEDALRAAIKESYAVLYVASPNSRRSPYVQDELAIAEMYNCPVYPVWAHGTEWIDSIPMGMGKMQFIDARDNQYSAALMELVMVLGAEAGGSADQLSTETQMRLPPDFVPRNPYKGLRAFRGDDRADFFGRTALIHDLSDALSGYLQPGHSRLLTVVGPSGSGKSSVVMAGLLPALQNGLLPESNTWTYLPPMVPGVSPLENLMITLASALPAKSQTAIAEDLRDPRARALHTLARQIIEQRSSRVVLYIDQFEELFTQTQDEAERQQFINLLLTAVSEPGGPVVVVVTLRADFYDRPMNYPELGKLVETNSRSVLPMSLADLFDVVQKPAQLPDVMLKFESGLVAELTFEVRDQIGGLPLLQFTLDQLFERRNGRNLTFAAYHEMGGVRGALTKHTEATYANLLSDDHRRLARGLFLRLIEPGSTEQDTTRRRAPRSELILADADQNRMMDGVIDAFVKARLLLIDQQRGITTVEVSHEALIREWGRLGDWLNEARSDIETQQNISADTEAWVVRQRRADDDGLYRGTLLEQAQLWAGRNLPSSDETAFINASETLQTTRRDKEAAIARRVQRFELATRALGVMSVIALVAFAAAIFQVTGAQQQLATATAALGEANFQQGTAAARVDFADTQVYESGQTLTPVIGTLSVAQAQIDNAQLQVTEAGALAATAQDQANAAGTQVAASNNTQTPVALTLQAGEEQLAAANVAVTQADQQAATANALVIQSGLTLTPVALTLQAGDNQLATATFAQGEALVAANDARTRAAAADNIAATATVEQGNALIAANDAALRAADADVKVEAADTQVADAGTQAAVADEQAGTANALVFQSGLTLTPVPLTLTPVALTLAFSDQQLQTAQFQVSDAGVQLQNASTAQAQADAQVAAANLQVNDAGTQVADARATLLPIPQTLTPIAETLTAADAQLAGVQPTLTAAQDQINGVMPTVQAA
ncbi:MAG: protein kinase, partial [Armatimonadetes bacterium]|nr:protein kinase [Anaerolineae bacterium]